MKNFEISPNGSSSGAHEEYETSRGNVFEEHLIVPKDSPDHQHHEENVQITSTQKEAFSQTENDVRNVSIQCRNNEDSDFREFTSIKIDGTTISKEEVKQNFPLNAKQVENKENLLVTKKPFKSKPYPDAYVSQIMKLKKSTSEHEIQLMSTLKGLRAEASIKDKENRKLRAEIDVLKTQIKKLSKKKSEIIKKCNRGTQTIALGPITQRPYNSEIYEG